MRLQTYIASHDPLKRVKQIIIQGCRAQDSMRVVLQTDMASEIDSHGIVKDGVWKLVTSGLPDRWVRLWNGWESLKVLLTKYSFFDAYGCAYNLDLSNIVNANASSCSNTINAHVTHSRSSKRDIYVKLCNVHTRHAALIPCHVPLENVGVAQLSARSGICWWGSMWFALCFSPDCLQILHHYILKSKHPSIGPRIHNVLKSKTASEALRRQLYRKFGIGDDPKQAPELDGQNGFAQFSIFCTKFDIPMITLMAPWLTEITDSIVSPIGEEVSAPRKPTGDELAFLGIRTYRAMYVPKFEFEYQGRRWKLRSAMIGSEFCGHQIAISSCCGEQSRWAAYDSDGVKECIGPIGWDISENGNVNEKLWWGLLDKILPVINQSENSTYCDMNPHNRHPLESVNRAHIAEFGTSGVQKTDLQTTHFNRVNIDWIYTS